MKSKRLPILFVVATIVLAFVMLETIKQAKKAEEATSPSQVINSSELVNIKTLEVDQKAPDFSVTTIDNKKLTLARFEGKVLVVTSGAAWCPTCWLEAKNFQPAYEEFKGRRVEFLTVSIDSRDDESAVKDFQKQYAPWHNVHSGQARDMIKDYGFWHFEITYIIDKDGVVRFVDMGITDTEVLRNELDKLI